MVQITGVLSDPLGNPIANAKIRVTSVKNKDTLWGISGSVMTGVSGSYDFTLKEDIVLIEILDKYRQYKRAGTVNTTGAVGPLTLEELFENYVECENPLPLCTVTGVV